MFQVTGPDDAPSKMHHLAHIVAFLGPPPADFLKKSSIWPEYFNEDGKLWHDSGPEKHDTNHPYRKVPGKI